MARREKLAHCDKHKRIVPRERDPLGKEIDSWPSGAWRSPVRDWWVMYGRIDNGQTDSKPMRGMYHEIVARRDEDMATGKYNWCWIKEELWS